MKQSPDSGQEKAAGRVLTTKAAQDSLQTDYNGTTGTENDKDECRLILRASDIPLREVKFPVAIYPSFYETIPTRQEEFSFDELVDFALNGGNPYRTEDKRKGPYFTGPMKRAPLVATTREKAIKAGKVGDDLIGVMRSKSHSLGGALYKHDWDDIPEDEFKQGVRALAATGLAFVIYTTFKHGSEKGLVRARVLTFGDRVADPDEFSKVSEVIGLALLGRSYDESEHRAYQLAGIWMCPNERFKRAKKIVKSGKLVDTDAALEAYGSLPGKGKAANAPEYRGDIDLSINDALGSRGPFSISRNKAALKSALYELDPNTEHDWWEVMKVTKGAMELPEASDDEKAWFWDMVIEWSRQSDKFTDEAQQRGKMDASQSEHPRTLFIRAREKNSNWANPGEDRVDPKGLASAPSRDPGEVIRGVKTWDAHRSDTLTSEIFVESFGDRLKYVLASETWLFWDGACWTASNRGEVTELAKRIGTAIFDDYGRRRNLELENAKRDGAVDPDKEATKVTAPWMALSKRTCTESGVKAMVRLAQSHPAVAAASFAEFNTDPFLLNVGNGILDLKTGVLGPHDPRAMMSQITRLNYNPEAQCPRWMKFLDEIMLGDEDTIKTLQQWMGYNLTGSMSLELVAIYFGGGANGKSVFINTMARVAGDYSIAASRSLLVEAPKSNANAPRSDIMATIGKRMAEINETQDRDVLDENTVKGLASPDKISARDLRERQTTFAPTAKVSLRTQHLPIVKGADEGIWRRLLPIEFKASFIGRENVNLTAELWEEAEGILAWAVRGAVDLYAPNNLNEAGLPKGIFISQAVKRTRDTYRTESDLLGQFLDEYELTSMRAYEEAGASEKLNMRTDIGLIHMSFKSWCDATGIQAWSQPMLGRRLNERGVERLRTNGRTYYYLKRKRH